MQRRTLLIASTSWLAAPALVRAQSLEPRVVLCRFRGPRDVMPMVNLLQACTNEPHRRHVDSLMESALIHFPSAYSFFCRLYLKYDQDIELFYMKIYQILKFQLS